MNLSLKKLLVFGVSIELIIILVSYGIFQDMGETFRYAARYSGRFSAIVFLLAFSMYVMSLSQTYKLDNNARKYIIVFAILHVIHLGFLTANIFLNNIPLELHKLAGGALAYVMIVIAPFWLHKVSLKLQLTYFYYVGFVMIMTYVARIKGDFEGAQPSWIHYLMIMLLISSCVLFGFKISKITKLNANKK